jgi:hypothetical protein
MSPVITEHQLTEFFIHGFRRALLRHRTFVVAGWAITALGALGFLGSFPGMERGDLLVVVIPLVTMAAGILIVHLSIVALESYVTTPFPMPDPGEIEEPLGQILPACRDIMKEVAEGGWKEAFDAIRTLSAMEMKSEELRVK